MRNTAKFLATFGAILFLIPASDALAQRRRGLVDISPRSDRHGFWFTLGAGAGSENYRFDRIQLDSAGPFVKDSWRDNNITKPSFWLAAGGTVNPNLRLGGEINAWVDQHFDEPSQYDVTDYLVGGLLTGQVFPSRRSGFFFKGGLGISKTGTYVHGCGYSDQCSSGETGFAWLAGAGYEIRLGRSIFLTPAANFMMHRSDGARDDPSGALHERVFTIGVGLTVQPGR
jgi:hypothetical protein